MVNQHAKWADGRRAHVEPHVDVRKPERVEGQHGIGTLARAGGAVEVRHRQVLKGSLERNLLLQTCKCQQKKGAGVL